MKKIWLDLRRKYNIDVIYFMIKIIMGKKKKMMYLNLKILIKKMVNFLNTITEIWDVIIQSTLRVPLIPNNPFKVNDKISDITDISKIAEIMESDIWLSQD